MCREQRGHPVWRAGISSASARVGVNERRLGPSESATREVTPLRRARAPRTWAVPWIVAAAAVASANCSALIGIESLPGDAGTGASGDDVHDVSRSDANDAGAGPRDAAGDHATTSDGTVVPSADDGLSSDGMSSEATTDSHTGPTSQDASDAAPGSGVHCPPRQPAEAGIVTLASGQNGASAIAVDCANVYWTNHNDGTVIELPPATAVPTAPS